MVNRTLNPKKFFTNEEKDRIVRAIQEAERKTSGEIRIFLERRSKKNILERSERMFEKLGMARTEDRNGILLYFSIQSRDFAILGDRGIHEKVGNDFWKDVVSKMQNLFAKGDFVGGLEAGIREVGEKLKTYFPRKSDDINELSDEIET